MKKILLLGGSAQQCIAINTAKEMGFYTILCDYLPDNPGQFLADKFYIESTTDKETILKIARKEKVDGVLAYASDPAAPTAAYVATKLSLPTNPYLSVQTLCNKNMFRHFLKEHNFAVPNSMSISNAVFSIENIKSMMFPIIVKPSDSSGSKGVTVIDSFDEQLICKAIQFALEFSHNKTAIIEEFILKDHPYLIGGDIVVSNGEVVLFGLLNCHRDARVNALVPVGKSFPLKLQPRQIELAKETLKRLVNELGIKFGEMNVELIIDKNNRCFLVDVGPRPGGNMIPELLGSIYGVNLAKYNVALAMQEKTDFSPKENKGFFASHNLHSNKDGVFEGIQFDEHISKCIFMKNIYKKPGDKIELFDNASKAIGIIFMKFDNQKEQDEILGDIYSHIRIEIK